MLTRLLAGAEKLDGGAPGLVTVLASRMISCGAHQEYGHVLDMHTADRGLDWPCAWQIATMMLRARLLVPSASAVHARCVCCVPRVQLQAHTAALVSDADTECGSQT